MSPPKHERDDYDPLKVENRPTGFEESARTFSKEIATPKKSTALDQREMLSNIPQGLEVELSMMNGISDIVQAHLEFFGRLESEPMTPAEKTELEIAISGMRSIQKHLYQNWMGQKGWKMEKLIEGLNSVSVAEGLLQRSKDEGLGSRVKKALHLG